MLECSCHIISYLADVMNALRQSSGQGTSALLMEGEEKAMEVDSDWVEELAVEEDDSQAEDSVSPIYVYSQQFCKSAVFVKTTEKKTIYAELSKFTFHIIIS